MKFSCKNSKKLFFNVNVFSVLLIVFASRTKSVGSAVRNKLCLFVRLFGGCPDQNPRPQLAIELCPKYINLFYLHTRGQG